jgi:hypothetical protein
LRAVWCAFTDSSTAPSWSDSSPGSSACGDVQLLDRAFDHQAVAVDRRNVLVVRVAQEHVAVRASLAPTVPPIAPAPTTTYASGDPTP